MAGEERTFRDVQGERTGAVGGVPRNQRDCEILRGACPVRVYFLLCGHRVCLRRRFSLLRTVCIHLCDELFRLWIPLYVMRLLFST